MLRLLSFALLAVTCSADCSLCLNGQAPTNPGAIVDGGSGILCGYYYENPGQISEAQCHDAHMSANQAVCGCGTDAPVAVTAADTPAPSVTATGTPTAQPSLAVTTSPSFTATTSSPTPAPSIAATPSPTSSPSVVTGSLTTNPSESPSAIVVGGAVTSTPTASPSRTLSEIPTFVAFAETPAPVITATSTPVAGNETPDPVNSPVSSAPVTPPTGDTVPSPILPTVPSPVPSPVTPTVSSPVAPTVPAPVVATVPSPVAPTTLVVPSTDAPVEAPYTSAPIGLIAPSCTGLNEDPYQFFGNGSRISCCNTVDQCLDDWNNNSVVYYRCVEKGSCPNNYPGLEPEIPPVCTGYTEDPYQVYGNGSFIPCCNPTYQCLNTWDGDQRTYFKCVNQCKPNPIPPPVCTIQDNDPFQFFGNGTVNKCCPGLGKCLDDWNQNNRFYYRCLPCCADTCAAGTLPSPTSTKTGVSAAELGNFAPTGELGIYSYQSIPVTSRAFTMGMSMVGILLTGYLSLQLL